MQIRRNCPISNSQRADDIAFDFVKREEATKRIDQSVKKKTTTTTTTTNFVFHLNFSSECLSLNVARYCSVGRLLLQ